MNFVHELRVRYGECDAQGHVFNAHYLLYFDVAYTELFRAAVGPWSAMAQWEVDSVVAEAALRFRAPARFDDVLQLQLRIGELGRSSVPVAFEVRRDGDLLVEGDVRHVVVSTGDWRPTEMPAAVRDGLSRFT